MNVSLLRSVPGWPLLPVILGGLLVTSLFAPGTTSENESQTLDLQIIVVNSSEAAQAILARLKSGEEFGKLARESSTDPTANQDGHIGGMDPAALRPELRDALQGVAPGQLTKVVKISSGYAILKVLKHADGRADTADPTKLLPLSGVGAVRLSADIGGFTQANIAMAVNKPKSPDFAKDLHGVCEVRQQAIPSVIAKLEDLLKQGNADPDKAALANFTVGQLWAYGGDMDHAIEHWQAGYETSVANHGRLTPQLEEALGVAYLYRASPPDKVPQHGVDQSQIFPSHPLATRVKAADLQKAVAYLSKSLQRDPSNLELAWLLDLAHMPEGKYSKGEAFARFTDVAPAAGLNISTTAGGAIVDDFDNDGLLDVVTSEQDDCAALHYFHNDGDGTFSNRTDKAGLSDQFGGLNIIQADYNNDGCVDILVLRGAWEFPKRTSLLRNNCDGTFSDVTLQSGLARTLRQTQSAVWTDIDNDGKLDLFIANENSPAELFLNKGDGTFTDISHSAGVDRVAFSKAVVAGDYDNDGYPDFYVSNLNGLNFLYHNNRDRTFSEVGAAAGVQRPWTSFAAWFFDYDNDGLPDLFVTSYYASTEETAKSYLGAAPNAETLKLYKNLGTGHFQDVTAQVKLDRVFMPMGSNFGDIDNDGFLDIYLGNGNPSFASLLPNVLLHNKEGKSFTDVTAASGTGAMSKGHGVAFADFENSGLEDIFVVMGGAVPGDRHRARLFKNPGNDNNWITLQLVGVKSNRSAIGARIRVTVDDKDRGRRNIYRTVSSGGSFGASPLQQHIGIGHASQIANIEIWWPSSNTRQSFSNVASNQFLQIKEFASDYTRLIRPSLHLGGHAF